LGSALIKAAGKPVGEIDPCSQTLYPNSESTLYIFIHLSVHSKKITINDFFQSNVKT